MDYFYTILPKLTKLISIVPEVELQVNIYDEDNIAISLWALDVDGSSYMVSNGYIEVSDDVDKFFEDFQKQLDFIWEVSSDESSN